MQKISSIFASFNKAHKNKYIIILFCFLFLFLPIINVLVAYGKYTSGSIFAKNLFFNTALAYLLFRLIISLPKKIAVIILLIVTTIYTTESLFKVGYLCIYKTTVIPQRTWYDILSTNNHEYTEYLQLYLSSLIWEIVYLIFALILVFFAIKNFQKTLKLSIPLIPVYLVIIGLIVFVEHKKVNELHDGYFGYYGLRKEAAKFQDAIKQRHSKFKEIKYSFIDEDSVHPDKIVIIVGESTSKFNMSLYGYGINTNPKLSQRNDLLLLNKVVTPYAGTGPALNYILTFGSHTKPNLMMEAPSIVDIFKSLGYKTKWLTNQGVYADLELFTGVGNLYLQIAKTCDTVLDVHKINDIYDETVLKPFATEIAKPEKQVIFVHLLGSHMAFDHRYPEKFNKWIDPKNRGMAVEKYNNTVYYNDYIVDSLLNISNQYKNNFTCYFSDHGDLVEGVCPDGYIGHNIEFPNIYNVSVPLFFLKSKWTTDSMMQTYQSNKDKLYSLEDLIHGVFGTLGVKGMYIENEKCIFSNRYVEIKRNIGTNIPYEELIKSPCGLFKKK